LRLVYHKDAHAVGFCAHTPSVELRHVSDRLQVARHVSDLAQLRAALVGASNDAEEEQRAKDAGNAEDNAPSSHAAGDELPSAGGADVAECVNSANHLEGDRPTAAAAQGAPSGNARLQTKIAKKKPSTIASNYAEAIKVADDFTALLELLLAWLARSSRGFGRCEPSKPAASVRAVTPRAPPSLQQDWSDDDSDQEAGGCKEGGLTDDQQGEAEGGVGAGATAPLRLRPLQHDEERGLSGCGREAVALVKQVLQLENAKVINRTTHRSCICQLVR
jgi:hypothetical protein